jgi:cell division protein FtsQ
VLTGINEHDSLAARRARMALYLKFVLELDAKDKSQSEQVSEIDLSDPEDLRATMTEQGSDILAHFGQDHFAERLDLYKTRIAGLRRQFPRLTGVDLRYEGEIPLEMSPAVPATSQTEVSTPQANPASNSPSTPKTATKKAEPASRKTEEAKRRAARLRAERLRAARARASHAAHSAPMKQGR